MKTWLTLIVNGSTIMVDLCPVLFKWFRIWMVHLVRWFAIRTSYTVVQFLNGCSKPRLKKHKHINPDQLFEYQTLQMSEKSNVRYLNDHCVTRPLFGRVTHAAARRERSLFTSHTFCPNNSNCILRLNENIHAPVC